MLEEPSSFLSTFRPLVVFGLFLFLILLIIFLVELLGFVDFQGSKRHPIQDVFFPDNSAHDRLAFRVHDVLWDLVEYDSLRDDPAVLVVWWENIDWCHCWTGSAYIDGSGVDDDAGAIEMAVWHGN